MEEVAGILESFGNTLSSHLGLIGALTGLVAAVAGLWSARAAARSAKHAEDVDRRGWRRDVIGAAQNIIAGSRRIEDLATKLTQAYHTLAAFSGSSGSSLLQLYLDEIAKLKQEVAPMKDEAEKHITDQEILQQLSEEDLTGLMVKLDGHLTQVRIIKEKLEYDLKDIESQNAVYREKAINKFR